MMINQQLDRGIVYIATQQISYLKMAIASAITLKELGEQNPIIIYSDLIEPYLEIDNQITVAPVSIPHHVYGFKSRYLKTRLHISPFKRTLFLDADIFPLKPIDDIWSDCHDAHSLLMALAYKPTVGQCDHVSSRERDYTLELVPHYAPQYNSGVILFDNNESNNNLFNCWHEEWNLYKKHDQLALARAIHKTSSKPYLLDSKFNKSSCLADNDTVLIHYSGNIAKPSFWEDINDDVFSSNVDELIEEIIKR